MKFAIFFFALILGTTTAILSLPIEKPVGIKINYPITTGKQKRNLRRQAERKFNARS